MNEIEIKYQNKIPIIILGGHIAIDDLEELRLVLDDLIVKGNTKIVIDCSGIYSIVTPFISILISALKKGLGVLRQIILVGVNKEIKDIFNSAGASFLFQFKDTIQEAINSTKNNNNITEVN